MANSHDSYSLDKPIKYYMQCISIFSHKIINGKFIFSYSWQKSELKVGSQNVDSVGESVAEAENLEKCS